MSFLTKSFKYAKIILSELVNLIEIPIVSYPNSKVSNIIRSFYYKKILLIGVNPLILDHFDIRSKSLINIGNNVQINKNVTMDATGSLGIYIGSQVSIGPGCYLRSANHSFSDDVPIQQQGWDCKEISFENKKYSIVIEDDVWIGANAIILSGAHVGRGSVLSAGTLVSSVIPAKSVVGGNPGRVIKKR